MNIDEAIKHCKDIAESNCNKCGAEHMQLAKWLERLKAYEKTGLEPEEIIKNTTVTFDIGEEGFLRAIDTVFKQRFGVMTNDIPKIISKYQEYKDLEEQGLLIKLPMQLGELVLELQDNILEKRGIFIDYGSSNSVLETLQEMEDN